MKNLILDLIRPWVNQLSQACSSHTDDSEGKPSHATFMLQPSLFLGLRTSSIDAGFHTMK